MNHSFEPTFHVIQKLFECPNRCDTEAKITMFPEMLEDKFWGGDGGPPLVGGIAQFEQYQDFRRIVTKAEENNRFIYRSTMLRRNINIKM